MCLHPPESCFSVSSKPDLFSVSSRIHPFPLSSMENSQAEEELAKEKRENNCIKWTVSFFTQSHFRSRRGGRGMCLYTLQTQLSAESREREQRSQVLESQALGPGFWFWNLKSPLNQLHDPGQITSSSFYAWRMGITIGPIIKLCND